MSDILDTIDGAIEDWETSSDAMRWMPPQERTWRDYTSAPPLMAHWHEEGESLPVQEVGPFRIFRQVRDDMMLVRVEFDSERYRVALARVTAAMEHLSRQFEGLQYEVVPDDESVRERALRLTQHRGHGPEQPLDRRARRLP